MSIVEPKTKKPVTIKVSNKLIQVCRDHFPALPDDCPLIPMINAGVNAKVSIKQANEVVEWLIAHGDDLEIFPHVTPGQGVKKIKNHLIDLSCQALGVPNPNVPKKKKTPRPTMPKVEKQEKI